MEALADGRPRVKELQRRIEDRLDQLAPLREVESPLHAAVRHAVLSPGKRLRPLLTLLCATHLGADDDVALDPACAIEFVHAASLALDDLPCMDDADERRGQPSTHRLFGEDMAVLASVALLNQAFGLIAGCEGVPDAVRLRMIGVLSGAVGMEGLVIGQARDLRSAGGDSLSGLSDLHHHKTGVLFVAAVRMGALAAGATADEDLALADFAAELGLAFQAMDDLDDAPDAASDGRNVVALLGREGARSEAQRRLDAARNALRAGGPRTVELARYMNVMLPMATTA